jgi:uncharacterized protein (TIGR03437 family)
MNSDGSNRTMLTNGPIVDLDWRPSPISTSEIPEIAAGGIVAATGTPVVRTITANSILTLFGEGFAPEGTAAIQPQLDSNDRVATNLENTCVEISGERSPIFAVLPNQINLQASHLLNAGAASVVVIRGCDTVDAIRSDVAALEIAAVAPAFFNFVINSDGVNPIAALHGGGPDLLGPVGLFAGATTTPASPGEFVSLFATGLGPTSPFIEAGEIPGRAAAVTGSVTVTIGGIELSQGDISYVGVAPCCAGLYQVVVRVPNNAPDGNLPVIMTVDGVSSPLGPFIAVDVSTI